MSAAEELDRFAQPTDFKRDRYGRPLIIPADGGKPVAYQRASGAAKPIEDTYNLELWHRRNVAYGVAADPSLVARVLAIGGTPQTWSPDEKKAINAVVEAANIAAKAHAAADTGTAVHALIEKVNRGEDPGNLGAFAADIEAYRQAIADIGWVINPDLVEVRMVCDELRMAGTADLVAWDPEDDCYYIGDLKTGATVDYATLSHSCQIATYAHSDIYDIATGRRTKLAINTDIGFVIHLPAGRGECTIHQLNLSAGFKAAQLANKVRETRTAAKKWSTPVTSSTATAPTPVDGGGADSTRLRARVATILETGHGNQLVWRWPHNVPGFKSDHQHTADELARIDQAVTAVEAEAELPFDPPPSTPAPKPVAEPVVRPAAIDEGALVHEMIYHSVEAAYSDLDDHLAAKIQTIAKAAAAAGYPISVSQKRSERRINITLGLIAWAQLDADPELLGGVLAYIHGNDHDAEFGAAIGQLTLEQAEQFHQIFTGIDDGTLTVVFTTTGVDIKPSST